MLLIKQYAKVTGEIMEATDLDGQEKALFAALAYHYNHSSGRCDPSLARLEKVSGLNRRTIIRRLHSLEEKGYIRREKRKDEYGTRISNSYSLKGYVPGNGEKVIVLNKRFALVSGEIMEAPDLDCHEKAFFSALAYHYNHSSGRCDPSLARLADIAGFSSRTAARCLNSLEEKGYIRREKRTDRYKTRISNSYSLKGYALDSDTQSGSPCQSVTQTENKNIKEEQKKPEQKNSDSDSLSLSGTKIVPLIFSLEKRARKAMVVPEAISL